ncbi:uncharacterized protein [Littorina saxatilis]
MKTGIDKLKMDAKPSEPLCAGTPGLHLLSEEKPERKGKRRRRRKSKKSESGKEEGAKTIPQQARSTLASDSRENKTEDFIQDTDDRIMDDILLQQPGDTIIFQASADIYTNDPLQFTLDVVSLWNTPHRDKAYIVMGVTAGQRLPNTVTGLQATGTHAMFQDMFQWQLFQQQSPKFTYREETFSDKVVGIIELEPNRSSGFPSIVTSDEMAPHLVKNQLWARRNVTNTVIEHSDQLVADIYTWFTEKAPVTDSGANTLGNNSGQVRYYRQDSATMLNSSQGAEVGVVNEACTSETRHVINQKGQDSTKILPKNNATTNIPALMKAVGNFETGHFVLVCGSLNQQSRKLRALARIPWLAVYDFDVYGRDSGLLLTVEESMKRSQGLSVCTWSDPHSGLTDLGTQWWSMRGRRDVPHSRTSDTSHHDWFARVRDKLDDLCSELARFSEDYTVLTILVLWPREDIEARCVHKMLVRVREYVQPRLILCSTDPNTDLRQSKVVEMIQYEYEDRAQLFDTPLEDLCDTIAHTLPDTICSVDNAQYELPAYDEGDTKKALTAKDANWLATDLDVLYLNSSAPKKDLTPTNLKNEKDNFFRGGTIRWYARYAFGKKQHDVERSILKDLKDYIQKSFTRRYRNGVVTLYHAPGSGGSTMAQRVLWDLHETVPCAQVKQRTGSSLEELAERLQFLHDASHKPVLALLDGEDEPRLKHIVHLLQRSHVILLHVRRYPYLIKESHVEVKHPDYDDPTPAPETFFLSGFVDKKESQHLLDNFTNHCDADKKKIEKLQKLNTDIQTDKEKHQMFEFGLTVYADDYKGIRAYVEGYLCLDLSPHNELDPWQKCLGYMSLVYFYGHCPVPCQFLGNIMRHSRNTAVALNDFPQHLQILVVEDTNMGKRGFIRVTHQLIAREILEQILHRGQRKVRSLDGTGGSGGKSGELSKEAKYNLKDFCLDFLQQIQETNRRSSKISHMVTFTLTKTFIFRDTEEIRAAEDIQTRRKPQFSQAMLDLDNYPPYEGRNEVFETLCETFPDDANFRAHVGRFFSICRPQEEEETKEHFKEALSLCYALSKGARKPGEIDEKVKQTLIHVLHMFGNAFQRRIVKYTGWNPGDRPALRTATADVERRLKEVISNISQACQYYLQARHYTTQGQEDGYTFMNEMQARLQACDFVSRVYPGGLQALLSLKRETVEVKFVRDSVPIIDDLIRACDSAAMLDRRTQGPLLKANVQWYSSLFNSYTPQLGSLVEGEDITSLRLDIATLKLKFRSSDSIVGMDSPRASAHDITSIVSKLEKVFGLHGCSADTNTRTLDLDYLDWILAIRNPNFGQMYTPEQVLKQIRRWYDTSLQSAQAVFYLFILNSLIGFGTSNSAGNHQCLKEAHKLQENSLPKAVKIVARPHHPREWVGRDSLAGIRRLVPGSSVKHMEHRITGKESLDKLAVFKGTIRRGNKKVAGYIDLDLGENSTPVKVFFVPLSARMVGTRYAGDRVQFALAFTFDKGYEAYEVRALERAACSRCNSEREMTWDCPEDVCSCGGVFVSHQST